MIDFLLKVKRTRTHFLPVPARAHETDSGFDLPLDLDAMLARIANGQTLEGHGHSYDFESVDGKPTLRILPGGFVWVLTGWSIELQPGYEGQLRGRSGLAFKSGLTVGHIGTVDAGFRGEVKVALANHGQHEVHLHHGDRIAQLIINQIPRQVVVEESLQLSEAPRGEKGYGSTGR